ncbi:hypothetical protein [Clostridium sp. OS1-26]|uniref:hypothetical protein n=1 Tax=Clostridium sp. OS1-26 TaxID=3070681 RepID=UPI0027E0A2E0|nr:hypothetical protein [Clostridium sp. OS1-26]WML36910.1 hypothetical protein RCG18_09985 [Clostridium sp. OS1-26]
MEKNHNANNQNPVTEQNVSQLGSPISGMSAEELYRQKEEYDAKFTLYKGSIPNR